MKLKLKASLITSLTISTLVISACTKSTPDWEFTPDMQESTSLKAQKEDPLSKDGAAARQPAPGSIPRNFQPFDCDKIDNEKAGKNLKNFLPKTKSVLERGQKIFNTYCIVCHGSKGDGAGYVVPPYPRPPTLLSDKVKNWADGNIFHVISCGQNLMPKYSTQIDPNDRWAIIHYVRALQRASAPTNEDIKELGLTK